MGEKIVDDRDRTGRAGGPSGALAGPTAPRPQRREFHWPVRGSHVYKVVRSTPEPAPLDSRRHQLGSAATGKGKKKPSILRAPRCVVETHKW